jgi:hypothetical protein
MQDLVQGTFQWDWVHDNRGRTMKLASLQQSSSSGRSATGPCTTKAAEGHQSGFERRLAALGALPGAKQTTSGSTVREPFKISKFKRVSARTDTFRQQAIRV